MLLGEIAILVALLEIRIPFRIFAGPLLVLMLAVALSLPAVAQAGPPFIGDDPGTPGDGNWEINVTAYIERHPSERIYNAPVLDANYGWGSRIQTQISGAVSGGWYRRRPDAQRIG